MRIGLVFLLLFWLPVAGQSEIVCDDGGGNICIETVHTDSSVTFFGISKFDAMPVTLSFDLDLDNLALTAGSADSTVLQGQERRELFVLSAKERKRWSYNYAFRWSGGDITAVHDDSVTYLQPFDRGKRFYIGQSCHGSFTHFDEQAYAIDFAMPVGTPLLAARAGKVVYVEERFDKGGPGIEFQNFGNEVAVLHEDNTMSIYVHLKENGSAVGVGDFVNAGELIGYSGNTGQSTGPHLHFAVVMGGPGQTSVTLPVTFETSVGPISCPTQGSRFPPRKPKPKRSVHRHRR